MPKWYSIKGLWSLFLMCAFPLHVWTLILSFNDFSWVAKRTNAWDAVGVIAYGLIFALLESVLVFLVASLAGLLISTKWAEPRRIALLSAWVLILSAWAMVDQSHFLWGLAIPKIFMQLAAASDHPLRSLYLIMLVPVLLTALLPVFLILQRERVFSYIQSLFDRISLLTVFYLIFDAAGLVIVIIRNIH
jgi:hypothetical protein